MTRYQQLMIAAIMTATLTLTGCVNLDGGRTTSTKASMIPTPKQMQQATLNNGGSFMAKVKSILPKRKPRVLIQDTPIASDDPTRLDYDAGELGPEIFLAAARMSEKNGQYATALDQYNSALKVDGRNRSALIGMARLQHKTGNTDEAIAIYKKALRIHQNDAVIMNDLGLCHARNNQLPEAIRMLDGALRLAPDREMYRNNLAAALIESNRTPDALNLMSQRYGQDVANFRIGYLLEKAGKQQESQFHLSRALVLNPDLTEARMMMERREAQRVSALSPGQRSAQ